MIGDTSLHSIASFEGIEGDGFRSKDVGDFRQLGKCLDSETSDRLRDIGERYFSAQPSTAKALEFENVASGREEAADGEPPAKVPAEPRTTRGGRRLMVISTGRAARTATSNGQPRPVARPALITVDGVRVHGYAASFASSA